MTKVLKEPMVIMPMVYQLPFQFWRWCNLSEVCEVAKTIYQHLEINEYECTPENLVHRFAALVRFNKVPAHLTGDIAEKRKKKIFRYSTDGTGFWGTEVPLYNKEKYKENRQLNIPPHKWFELQVGSPYPKSMFVPEGWCLDTLKLIHKGAISVVDYTDAKFAYTTKGLIDISEEGKEKYLEKR